MTRCEGTLLQRRNRFVADVRLTDGRQVAVHVASSGRMADVLIPGCPVVVDLLPTATADEPAAGRATVGRLAMARVGETWVSCDTALPGKLFRAAVAGRQLPPFAGYGTTRPEVTYGQSRIDFLLTEPGLPPCLVEVKSVTSALTDPDGVRVARFPDAPTERGIKHLHELAAALADGYRAAVCFVIQRDDVAAFGPYEAIDPAFGAALRAVRAAGVEIYAYTTRVSPEGVTWGEPVALRLG